MCGIICIIPKYHKTFNVIDFGIWQNHRGPDNWGEYIDENIILGHNRLSILDLNLGNQPMSDTNGNVYTVFNGEIYNFHELRRELIQHGYTFTTNNSDTEVIVIGYLHWGKELFKKLRGMFAGCIYDKTKNECLFFRDPLGIKPLYFLENSDAIFIVSELKPLLKNVKNLSFDEAQLHHYFTKRCSSPDCTFIKGINKVKPGTYGKIRFDDYKIYFRNYYEINFNKPLELSYNQKIEKLDNLLGNSIHLHQVSDVPLGIFLSGGVDSSLIAKYLSTNSHIEAFNIGSNSQWDETKYAKIAADDAGIKLNTKYIEDHDFLNYFENWTYYNDDPVADPSALALMVLSKFCSKHNYKVMLAGEGADELFLGYNIYLKYLLYLKGGAGMKFLKYLMKFNSNQFDDWSKFQNYLGAAHISNYRERDRLLTDTSSKLNCNIDKNIFNHHQSFMIEDLHTRLPNDLLTRTDRATMAYSIEARVPYLINEIIEFASSLNRSDVVSLLKLNGKKILKDLALRKIPHDLVKRKKRGFEIPIEKWIRNELQDQIHQFRKDQMISGINYVGLDTILKGNNYALIWSWLVLEKWYRGWLGSGIKAPIISSRINESSYKLV